MILELEIDERLHIGGNELVDNNHRNNHTNDHQPQRHHSEIKAVPLLELRRQPVNNHTKQEQNNDISVLPHKRQNNTAVPRTANLVDHIRCRFPRDLIGRCRVKVAGRTEEQACKGDESEGLRHRPGDAEGGGETATLLDVRPLTLLEVGRRT